MAISSQTVKSKLIRNLQQIPEDFLTSKMYQLDVIVMTGKTMWDSVIADKYRKYREISYSENWFVFEFGNWRILMETEYDT